MQYDKIFSGMMTDLFGTTMPNNETYRMMFGHFSYSGLKFGQDQFGKEAGLGVTLGGPEFQFHGAQTTGFQFGKSGASSFNQAYDTSGLSNLLASAPGLLRPQGS